MISGFYCDANKTCTVMGFYTVYKNEFLLDCFTLEDGTNRLSLNIGTELPFYTV
jgi:hypothetical protein